MAKIIFITGATAGIGRATALRLAADGYSIIATGRREERLKTLKKEIEAQYPAARILTLCFDVRDRIGVEQTIASLPEEWKNIDILVNNAGLAAGLAPIHMGEIDDWERMIDTNIKGLLYVTRTVSAAMVERRSGHIINIASIAGKEVYPNGNVYCATKHAVDALSKGIRMDLLPYGIKVTQICPGAVETEFSLVRFHGDQQRANSVYDGYTPLYAPDIADAIAYAINAPQNVDIQDMLVMCRAQASASIFHRQV